MKPLQDEILDTMFVYEKREEERIPNPHSLSGLIAARVLELIIGDCKLREKRGHCYHPDCAFRRFIARRMEKGFEE